MDEASDPWPFLAPFFQFMSSCQSGTSPHRNLKYKCKLCIGAERGQISCQSSSLSNLKKHIERKHFARMKEFEELTRTHKKGFQAGSAGASLQPTITQFCGSGRLVSQAQVNAKVLNFVINSNQPFTIVRDEAFVDLIETLAPGKKVICYETLMAMLADKYKDMKDDLKQQFSETKAICITTDAWSEAKKNFLGVTAHFLDSKLLRKSYAIACRRLTGSQTHDALAEVMVSILAEFNIQYKTVGAITDNGSNFCKAFKLFGLQEDQEEDEDLQFFEIHDLLNDGQDKGFDLPPHFRCAAHTLSLVATKDSEKALTDARFCRISRSTFAKLQGLWNKQGRSPDFARQVQEKYHLYFVIPNATRWNSTFDAMQRVQRMLEESPESFNDLLSLLNLPPLSQQEKAFIKEYCQVMKPLAQALDILQGERDIYMGILLPTITLLQKKLQGRASTADICKPLASALVEGLSIRFTDQMRDKRLIMAAICLPAFKLHWIDNEEEKHAARNILLSKLQELEPGSASLQDVNNNEDEDSFFPKKAKLAESAEEEICRYLAHPDDSVSCVLAFTRISKIFRKYNTLLPSSASCERLFSRGKNVFRKNRHSLKESSFEMQLLLSANKTAE